MEKDCEDGQGWEAADKRLEEEEPQERATRMVQPLSALSGNLIRFVEHKALPCGRLTGRLLAFSSCDCLLQKKGRKRLSWAA